jgi:hypothetical protein
MMFIIYLPVVIGAVILILANQSASPFVAWATQLEAFAQEGI